MEQFEFSNMEPQNKEQSLRIEVAFGREADNRERYVPTKED